MLASSCILPSRLLIPGDAGRTSKGANLTVLGGGVLLEASLRCCASSSGDGLQTGKGVEGQSSDVDSASKLDSMSGRNLFVDGSTHVVAGSGGDGKKEGMGMKPGRSSNVFA